MPDRRQEQKCEILVVEDDHSIAGALKMILEDNGYPVSTVATGREGIDEALRGQFCLTITDFRLTDMTGLDVIKTICRHKPHSHFILITSSGSPDVIAEAQSWGAVGVLLKPFQPSEILQMICSVVEHRT